MRSVITLGTILFSLILVSLAHANPMSIYGERIEFDVMRDGKKVGEHITAFTDEGDNFRVTSEMKIDISFLKIPLYSFRYESEETWTDNRLQTLSVFVNDDGDKTKIDANREKQFLNVTSDHHSYQIFGTIYSSNHWARGVTKEDRIINTLTGNLNFVFVANEGKEEIQTTTGPIEATRYSYSGDLEDTYVWYDEKDRWVKLQFLGSDGSTIEYICRSCGNDISS